MLNNTDTVYLSLSSLSPLYLPPVSSLSPLVSYLVRPFESTSHHRVDLLHLIKLLHHLNTHAEREREREEKKNHYY